MINYNSKLLAAFSISNGYAPTLDEGPRTIPVNLDFSTDGDVFVDFVLAQVDGHIGQVQGIVIDNTLNAFPVVIVIAGTGQRINVPAQTEMGRAIFVNTRFQAIFSSTISAAKVNVQLLNVPIAPFQNGPIAVNATASAVTGTYTDRSGVVAAAGVSQVLMAANALRKGLIIQNPSTEIESLWINFTGVANIGQPSIELTPGASFPPYGGISTQQITVIAATINHPYVAKELL